MANYLYLRGLKQVDHTVFGVVDGQKYYYSPTGGNRQPYSSGQQVKRSILDAMVDSLPNEQRAPITFNYEVSKKKGEYEINQKEPWNPCDPSFADQLIGGWMRAEKGEGTIRRRSPLSISAMRPLHPSLANLESDESGTFDRSDKPEQNILRVRDEDGKEMTKEDIKEVLEKTKRNIPLRNWLKLGPRANGLFVFDIAVDLDRLFTVSTNQFDPELEESTIEKLKEKGWKDNGTHLVAPAEQQEKIISALADALVNWRITSNQSRTFSPQGTLAVAISQNANSIVNAIRADLRDEQTENGPLKADPIIDETIDGVQLFVSAAARGYIQDAPGTGNAMNDAQKAIEGALRKALVSVG